MAASLRQLARDGADPFSLLAGLEDRCRIAAMGTGAATAHDDDWVGVGFRLGEHRFVAARAEVREILKLPDSTRIPGAKSWLKGLANVRGQLLPIVDLGEFLEGATTAGGKQARALVVNHDDVSAGLVVDEVLGFRRFAPSQATDEMPDELPGDGAYVTGAYRTEDGFWGVFSLHRLVESTAFLQAAE